MKISLIGFITLLRIRKTLQSLVQIDYSVLSSSAYFIDFILYQYHSIITIYSGHIEL